MRCAVLLLIALEMLLPPGLCVCRLDLAVPRSLFAAERARPTAKAAPRCPCCRPEVAPELASGGQLSSPPAPERPHAPGCPAHPTYEVARASCYSAADAVLPDLLTPYDDISNQVMSLVLPILDPPTPLAPPAVLRC